MAFHETFTPRPDARWRITRQAGAHALLHAGGLRLLHTRTDARRYANAQIDDYAGLARQRFPWSPPLTLTVRAAASGPLAGTAGFGFWNSPISPIGTVLPVLPAALWFFHGSPPGDMPLAAGVPGHGWKAATIDATTRRAWAWAPLTLPVLLANRWPAAERRVWPRVQRDLAIAEVALPPLTSQPRSYTLDWRRDGARFAVDGTTLLETERVPRGPLGFVAWLDNQYMIATPRGRFAWGLLPTADQWLDLAEITITYE